MLLFTSVCYNEHKPRKQEAWEWDYTTYTVRFPELLGNKEGISQADLNCLHSIQAHYENNGIPASKLGEVKLPHQGLCKEQGVFIVY